jgi:hypothetical protein
VIPISTESIVGNLLGAMPGAGMLNERIRRQYPGF